MPDQYLTWIHLSDLHMELTDTFNRNIVLEALWRDIGDFVSRGIRPDFIAFTGDVSYHGLAQEYELAIKEFFDPLLAVAKIPKERLFVIPGNHDVNRKKTIMIKDPIPMMRSEDDIRKLLESADERELLLSPFSNYKDFVSSYCPLYEGMGDPTFSHCHPIAKASTEVIISVIGLNSAWLSGFHRSTDGDVQDYGNLAMGELQVRTALSAKAPFSSANLTIVLVHHPFESLMEADRIIVEDILTRNCSIVLRGHLHRPDVLTVSSLAGDLLVIPSGAVFDSRKSPNSYNIVQVDLSTGSGIVFFRRYSHRRNEWQKDIESTGESADGQVVFKLPKYWNETLEAGIPGASKWVSAYNCVFTEECKRDLSSLGLTQDDVIALVQGEFRSHMNYFRFDLEDYPLPVRTNYIVYLDKVQQRIEFRRVVLCTRNEAKLASWNDILALYRRATRMSYRENPTDLLFRKGMHKRISSLHEDIELRIRKHYNDFYTLTADSRLREDQTESSQNTIPASTANRERMGDEIDFHLDQSSAALSEVFQIVKSMEAGDISDNDAIGLIVAAFERSLQHIHKIILRYPPIGE